jgi:hypothetical protein
MKLTRVPSRLAALVMLAMVSSAFYFAGLASHGNPFTICCSDQLQVIKSHVSNLGGFVELYEWLSWSILQLVTYLNSALLDAFCSQ